ncbi:hypothetical protein AALA24_13525 [Anaerovoracaceae bacterium 42-11]
MIKLTEKEKDLINALDDSLFTRNFVEDWINRDDNVVINAPAALQSANAKGFYRAVHKIVQLQEKMEEEK